MTKLLEDAMQRVARLSAAEQDRIARLVLDEIEDEARWQATFAGSQPSLLGSPAHASADIAAGSVLDEDPSNRAE